MVDEFILDARRKMILLVVIVMHVLRITRVSKPRGTDCGTLTIQRYLMRNPFRQQLDDRIQPRIPSQPCNLSHHLVPKRVHDRQSIREGVGRVGEVADYVLFQRRRSGTFLQHIWM